MASTKVKICRKDILKIDKLESSFEELADFYFDIRKTSEGIFYADASEYLDMTKKLLFEHFKAAHQIALMRIERELYYGD